VRDRRRTERLDEEDLAPLIREKALLYLGTRLPSTHRGMLEKARPCNEEYAAAQE
jgi:hypothetical protein